MRVFIFAMLFALTAQSSTQGKAQLARFEVHFAALEKHLSLSDDEQVADALLASDARMAAFNLQALGRIYQSRDKSFKDFRFAFKGLEDRIGEFNKWVDIHKKAVKAGKPPHEIKKLEVKRDLARQEFVSYLKTEKWLPHNKKSRLAQERAFLTGLAWQSYDDDKADSLKVLTEQLKRVEDTDWDLSRLEEGNGLHEFRREMRWFVIQARVLNGLLTFKKDANKCPIKAYENLVNEEIAESKYAKLPLASTETNPCRISQCLFLGAVEAVNILGDLKDKAEVYNNINHVEDEDAVPDEIYEEAIDLLDTLLANDLLGELRSQIKSCN